MRSNADNVLLRGAIQDGVQLAKGEIIAITATLTLASGLPMVIAVDPASTSRQVTMYTPSVTALWHKHEIVNISAGTGNLNVVQADGTTAAATIQPGQRAEAYWNPKTALWDIYVQTKGNVNNAGSKMTLQQYTTLAALANSQVFDMVVPFNFTLTSIGFRTRVAASTAAKAATLTARVNDVAVTGGVVSLTTANQNTTGGLTAGTSITAGNTGTAGQVVGCIASAVTAFVEGDGYIEYGLTNTSVNQ